MAIETTIADTLQELAQTIASLVGLQVGVVSEQLIRVAKAGVYAEAIGVESEDGQVYRQAIQERKPVLVDQPRAAQLVWPIVHEDRVLGCLGFVAVTQEQRRLLLTRQQDLAGLLSRLSELICGRLSDREALLRPSLVTARFEAVLDHLPEGMIVLDAGGRVLSVNRTARAMLGIEALGDVRGRPLDSVVFSAEIKKCLGRQEDLVESPLAFRVARRTIQCIGTVRWVRSEESGESLFCLFRTLEATERLAARLCGGEPRCTFEDILGISPAIVAVKDVARRVAAGDSTVLLSGESGTGKELFARAIHWGSRRAGGPFVAVNCGAIPDSLLESELFGYEEGAFTGARRGGKPGKFEMADGGTLLLDEIGELPLHVQVKLLRVLEERRVERLGGVRQIPLDIRIVAATNSNLQELVSAGRFRRDLYYRINVVPVHIPPLRERPEDIEYLAHHLVRRFSERTGRQVAGISEEVAGILRTHLWPGNVRELQNVIEYAVNFERGEMITLASLPRGLIPDRQEGGGGALGLASLERQAIHAALSRYGRDGKGKRAAARALGIHLSTLYRKLRSYG